MSTKTFLFKKKKSFFFLLWQFMNAWRSSQDLNTVIFLSKQSNIVFSVLETVFSKCQILNKQCWGKIRNFIRLDRFLYIYTIIHVLLRTLYLLLIFSLITCVFRLPNLCYVLKEGETSLDLLLSAVDIPTSKLVWSMFFTHIVLNTVGPHDIQLSVLSVCLIANSLYGRLSLGIRIYRE